MKKKIRKKEIDDHLGFKIITNYQAMQNANSEKGFCKSTFELPG